MRHDIIYMDNKNLQTRHAADRKMLQEINSIPNPSLRERLDRAIVNNSS